MSQSKFSPEGWKVMDTSYRRTIFLFSLELPEDLKKKKTTIAGQYDQKGSHAISKAVIGFSPCRPRVMRDFWWTKWHWSRFFSEYIIIIIIIIN
jgi:hypothetical protein